MRTILAREASIFGSGGSAISSTGIHPEVPKELSGYVDAYRGFLAEWRPRFVAVEQIVCSLRHGYVVTCDA